MLPNWTNVLLGLWVMAIPFLGFAGETLMWALVLTGAAIIALAVWGAGLIATERTEYERRLQHR
jgi:hypothetical protein